MIAIGAVWLGWLGVAWHGEARPGMARLARLGQARPGAARRGSAGLAWRGMARRGRRGLARRVQAWRSPASFLWASYLAHFLQFLEVING
jgi:hypothetical protein